MAAECGVRFKKNEDKRISGWRIVTEPREKWKEGVKEAKTH